MFGKMVKVVAKAQSLLKTNEIFIKTIFSLFIDKHFNRPAGCSHAAEQIPYNSCGIYWRKIGECARRLSKTGASKNARAHKSKLL